MFGESFNFDHESERNQWIDVSSDYLDRLDTFILPKAEKKRKKWHKV